MPHPSRPQAAASGSGAGRTGSVRLALAGMLALFSLAAAGADVPSAPLVEVDLGAGGPVRGRLAAIGPDGVTLLGAEDGSPAPGLLPAERVRSVRRLDAAAATAGRLAVTLVDGGALGGDDFAWDGGDRAVIVRPEGRLELPIGRVRTVSWQEGAAAGGRAAWLDAVPEGVASDLVVVGKADGHEFVECALAAVGAEAVTVVLDEERIPVKRSKVIGLHWLRTGQGDGERAAGVAVSVAGGRVRAGRVDWSPEALVLDQEVRMPAALLVDVDYAAGRLTSLASLEAEKVDVEPWFGGLVQREGWKSFFSPRPIGGGDPAGIIMRPRTTAVWRLPADSRRFRAVVAPAAGAQAADAALVVVTLDDREVFRGRVDATSVGGEDARPEPGGVPIDVDLADARRLKMTVDFVPGEGIGGAVLVSRAVIER